MYHVGEFQCSPTRPAWLQSGKDWASDNMYEYVEVCISSPEVDATLRLDEGMPLCSAPLCCAVLCCAVLCCAVLCCAVLRSAAARCVTCTGTHLCHLNPSVCNT